MVQFLSWLLSAAYNFELGRRIIRKNTYLESVLWIIFTTFSVIKLLPKEIQLRYYFFTVVLFFTVNIDKFKPQRSLFVISTFRSGITISINNYNIKCYFVQRIISQNSVHTFFFLFFLMITMIPKKLFCLVISIFQFNFITARDLFGNCFVISDRQLF